MTEITDIDFDPPKADPRDARIAELEKQFLDAERRAEYYNSMLRYQQQQQNYYNAQSRLGGITQQAPCYGPRQNYGW